MLNSSYKLQKGDKLTKWLFDKYYHPIVDIGLDHLYRLPTTSKSLVFFPYGIEEEKLPEFLHLCHEARYKMKIYPTGTYGAETLEILLIHEDDDNQYFKPNWFTELRMLQHTGRVKQLDT